MKSSEIDHTPFDCAISGGSFIGLTLAVALAKSSKGHLKVAVIDPLQIETPLSESDGRAFALSASSKALLDVIGVWRKVSEMAQPVTEIEVTDSALESVLRPELLHFDSTIKDNQPSTYILESHHLLNALKELAQQHDNVTLLSGTKIIDNQIEGRFQRIILDKEQTVKARLLIAADGKRSSLRKSAGIKTIGWSYDQMGIVTTLSHENGHNGKAIQHFLPSGPFALLPLTGNRTSIVWSEKTDIAKQMLALSDEDFLEEIRKRAGNRLMGVKLAGKRAMFPLNLQVAREYAAERFVLAGDAAHGVHPIAGLGFNIGVRDIAALTEVIINAQRLGLDFGEPLTLEKYTRWRRFDGIVTAFTMDGLNRLFSNNSTPVRMLRDFGLGLVNRSPALKNYFVNEAAGTSGDLPLLLQGKEI